METLFDVIGVGLLIWGVAAVLIAVLQFSLAIFAGKEAGSGKLGAVGGAFFLLITGGFGAFLIWAGTQIWGINNV